MPSKTRRTQRPSSAAHQDASAALQPTTEHAENDAVNHPLHYNVHPSGVECIDIIEHLSHNVGAAVKYCWRAGIKAGAGESLDDKEIEDLKKAVWYLNREIDRLATGAR